MPEIRKKGSSEEFEAGVGADNIRPAARKAESKAPDFEAGVMPGKPERAARPQAAQPETPRTEVQPARPAAPEPEPVLGRATEPEPKKRYYTPQEVMKKKGCIGCGGMILAVPLIIAAVALVMAVL